MSDFEISIMQNPFKNRFSRTVKRRRAAFSLLEVAIALAIFVIGALSIIKIFPGGLALIQSSSDKQSALNVSRTTLANLAKEPSRVPEAIYDNGLANTLDYLNFDGAVLASANREKSLPSGPEFVNVKNSALGRFRVVRGEGATVRKSADGLFVLTQFPVNAATDIQISEEVDVEGVEINKDGVLNFSNARFANSQETINSPLAPFQPAPPFNSSDCVYYVTYKREPIGAIPQIVGVDEEPTNFTENFTVLSHIMPITDRQVVPGIVKVRLRIPLFNSTLADNKEGGLGYIRIPTATPLLLSQNRPLALNDKILIDYEADWGRLIQEGVPEAPPESTFDSSLTVRQITTGAPYIARNSEALYSLVFAPNTLSTPDDDTPLLSSLNPRSPDPVPTPVPPAPATLIAPFDVGELREDLRTGRINFNAEPDLAGVPARISYITSDDWHQQLSVAARTYTPQSLSDPNPTDPLKEDWRVYGTTANISELTFPVSEAGKAVTVSYAYKLGAGPDVEVKERVLTISSEPVLGQVKLTLVNDAGFALTGAELQRIYSVRGASMTVRTAYVSGSRYKQAFVSAMRPSGDLQ